MLRQKFDQFFKKITKAQTSIQKNNPDVKTVVLQSNSLGFSVVEEESDENKLLTEDEWASIIEAGTFEGYSHGRIYFNFLKGIPNHLRLEVWMMMSCPKSLRQSTCENYLSYLSVPIDPLEANQIQVDLKRTYGNLLNYQFTSPILKNILSASSNYRHSYTQGMNYILIYVLIFSMESKEINQLSQVSKEFQSRVFSVFVGILDQMQRIFGHNLQKFLDVMKQLQSLLIGTLPQLMFSIAGMGFDVTSLLSQNYFSLMMYAAPPFEMGKMILDLFQLQGHKAIHAILIRMLELCSKQLMDAKSPQTFQKIIKTDIFNICGQKFIKQKKTANSIEEFGLSIFEKTEVD